MQKGREILTNFFQNVTNTVKAKLAALNPINNFIKYCLETTFDQFFVDQKLSYQSLLSGTLQLPDLKLDITKINHNYLFTSPFTLHSGKIGHLKIKLPSFLQMDTQNIQVEIKDVVLQMKPIQNFQENYKLIMEEIQQFLHLFVQQNLITGVLVQQNSQDYFKQTLRQLFTNMTIKIQNIAILLYIEDPELQNQINPYYLMLRVPLINVHKGDNSQIKQINVQETKFDCQIPQFTLHIMNINQEKKEGFKSQYPEQNHPSTILLFGLQNYKHLQIQTDETVPRLKISVSKNYEKAQKNTKLQFQFPKIQLMINPQQIKVVILIIKQINQFKQALKRVKKQLGIDNQQETEQIPVPLTMRKRSSLDKKNQEMFTSISMSYVGTNVLDFSKVVPKSKRIPGMLDSLIKQSQVNVMNPIIELNNALEKSVHENAQLGNQQQMIEQIKVIEFKKHMQIKVNIMSTYVYIQKFESSKKLQRKWIKDEKEKSLNVGLQNSYFLLAIQKFIYHSKEYDHTLKLQLSKLELSHVKFREYSKKMIQNKNLMNESNQFSDLRDSNCFYGDKQVSFNEDKSKNHYCVEQILRISSNSSQNSQNQEVKKHNFFVPIKQEKQNELYKPAFALNSQPSPISRLAVTKIQFMKIALSMNTQVMKQALDLYLLVKEQLQIAKKSNANNLNQQEQNQAYKQENKKRDLLTININQLNISYLDSSLPQYKSSVQKYMNGEKQKFDSCFCNMNTNGLYFQVKQIHYKQSLQETIMNFRKLDFGSMKIADSSIIQASSIISINPIQNQDKQQIKFQVLLCENINQKLSQTYIVLPEVVISIKQKQTLKTLQLIKTQLQNTKLSLSSISKKNKQKQQPKQTLQPRLEVYAQQLNIKILQAQLYFKQIYISSQSSIFIVKLQTMVIGISDKLQLFSSQMLDQKLILTRYSQHKHKHSFIEDGNIVLQIHDNKIKNSYKLSNMKLTQFFGKISKSTANLLFTINGGSPNQINAQYQPNQTIFLKIQYPIYICAVNILKLNDKKEQLKLFIQKVRGQKDKIMKLWREIFVSKSELNVSGNEQNYRQKLFTIQSGRIHVDIRPTYLQSMKVLQKDELKKIIFSNTRSFLQLSWNDLSIQMYIKDQKTYIKGTFHIRYLMKQMRMFNYHDEIIINKKDLQKQQYKQLLKIQKIQLFIEMIENHINTKIDINLIRYESNLKTLCYLILHWKQFIRHNIKKNFGFNIRQQQEQFQVLQANQIIQDQNDQPIQDLTNKSLFYKQKNQIKKNLLKKFINKSFEPFTSDKSYAFYLQGLTIKQFKLKIIHQTSQIQNIQFNMNQIQLKAKIKDFKQLQIQVLGTIKDIDLSYFCKQQENVGFFGSIYNYIYSNNYKKFTLLKNNHNHIIKFALQNNSDGSFIKFDKTSLDIGFTSRILDFVQKYKNFDSLIKQQGWKKVYNQPIINQNQNNNNHDDNILLIFAPQNNINISLIYQGVQILKQCYATAPQLLLNQYSNNITKINQYITSWIKSLLLKNVAGLVAKTLFDKFQLGVTQIVDLIIFFLSCIIGIFK